MKRALSNRSRRRRVSEGVGRIRKTVGAVLTFHTRGTGRPRDVSPIPFYRIAHERYNLYWKAAGRGGA